MKINVLTPKIYNRIAAGEVVEKPASVVKELVENSMDAGATKIKVEIYDGGIRDIIVTDNGCGIEKEDLKHIFERLYKCDKGRSEKGSGLGLSIVHQLVEKMNGTITAESTPGNGTMFALYFPLVD